MAGVALFLVPPALAACGCFVHSRYLAAIGKTLGWEVEELHFRIIFAAFLWPLALACLSVYGLLRLVALPFERAGRRRLERERIERMSAEELAEEIGRLGK